MEGTLFVADRANHRVRKRRQRTGHHGAAADIHALQLTAPHWPASTGHSKGARLDSGGQWHRVCGRWQRRGSRF
eukprot:scaffold206533_cov30-Tisochrysis_lutea.AAC.6